MAGIWQVSGPDGRNFAENGEVSLDFSRSAATRGSENLGCD